MHPLLGKQLGRVVADAAQVFLNIVLDDAVEDKDGGEKVKLGMVVCSVALSACLVPSILTPWPQVIRGNSVVMLEALERIGGDGRQRG